MTNTGTVTLENVTVVDDKLGPITLAKTTLAPGESTTGTASTTVAAADAPGQLVNVATAAGEGPGGERVTDQDDASVDLVAVLGETLPKTGLDADLAGQLGLVLVAMGLAALAVAIAAGSGKRRLLPDGTYARLRSQLLPLTYRERIAGLRHRVSDWRDRRRGRSQFRRLG